MQYGFHFQEMGISEISWIELNKSAFLKNISEAVMTLIASISRFVRRYIFSPEAFVLLLLLLVVYNSVFHVKPLWRFIQRAKVNIQLKWRGQYDNISNFPGAAENEGANKVSWELKKDNVAIYAIQGRRPHMEDRFNVVNDLEHTKTSIYGIFDGHGGEVCMMQCH